MFAQQRRRKTWKECVNNDMKVLCLHPEFRTGWTSNPSLAWKKVDLIKIILLMMIMIFIKFSVHVQCSTFRHLSEMRTCYIICGGQMKLAEESKIWVSLSDPSSWCFKNLVNIESEVLEPLIYYWFVWSTIYYYYLFECIVVNLISIHMY